MNFPIKLNNVFEALGRSVTTGDNKPTDESYAVFEELKARLAAEKKKLGEALAAGLPELNRLLQSRGLAAIDLPK